MKTKENRLKSWDDVDLNFKEITECMNEIKVIDSEVKDKISDLKLEATMKTKPLKDRLKVLEEEIEQYARDHRNEIKGKSLSLNFGKLGFRESTKIIIENVKATISILKKRQMFDCITLKYNLKKEGLKNYPDEVLKEIGAEKQTEESFYYKLN